MSPNSGLAQIAASRVKQDAGSSPQTCGYGAPPSSVGCGVGDDEVAGSVGADVGETDGAAAGLPVAGLVVPAHSPQSSGQAN